MERVFRDRRLNSEEVSRDQDLRRKIEQEFPPAMQRKNGRQEESTKTPSGSSATSSDRLLELAQSLADEWGQFFEKKGPGAGDLDTNAFMKELRARARNAFGQDYSEQRICGDSKLAPDFYFPEEETIVEVAMGLRNPYSEFERDILKAILAQVSSHPVRRLVFLSKPGARARISQPGLTAIANWATTAHGIQIEVREFSPVAEAVLDPTIEFAE
jgi:hypothetical protein